MSTHPSTPEVSKQKLYCNMNPDENEINRCDADVPTMFESSIDKADVVKYENSTQITGEFIEAGIALPTQTLSTNPQIVGISSETEAISIKPSNIGLTKQPETISTELSVVSQQSQSTSNRRGNTGISEQDSSCNMNQFSENAQQIYEGIIEMDELVDLQNIYEDMSIYDRQTQISGTDQLHNTFRCKSINIKQKVTKVQTCIMTKKCKLALALLDGLVVTVLIVSLIVWGVISSYQENIKAEPAINLTTTGFIDCWDKSANYSEHCNISLVTEPTDIKEINAASALLLRKRNAGIGFTAWATSVVSYSAGTTLIFNGMDEEQIGFDRSTGLFTCPRTGIYYVYITLRKKYIDNIYVDVFKMDTTIIRFSENHTGNPWNTISNSALVSCSLGEIIQMKGCGSGSIYGEANMRWSSFSVINVDQIAQNSPNQTFVGYSGYANSKSFSRGENMDFSNQLCNVGRHYFETGFYCPYTGIYFVSVSLWKYPSQSRDYRVFANVYTTSRTMLYLDDDENDYTYVTNNALVRCYGGQYFGCKGRDTSYLFGSGSYPESIFTIMSVHQPDQTKPFIGFSRWKKDTQGYSAGNTIRFTESIMDDEHYFLSYRFVCPVEGSYFFSLNVKKFLYYNIGIDLKHGDRTVFKLEDTNNGNDAITISNSAVITCYQGEIVTVVAAIKGYVYGDETMKCTTFSGFLLYNL